MTPTIRWLRDVLRTHPCTLLYAIATIVTLILAAISGVR